MNFHFLTVNQTLRIRFTYKGKRYQFYPGLKDTLANREKFTREISHHILLDMETGNFDETMKKYKIKNVKKITESFTLFEIFEDWLHNNKKNSLRDAVTIRLYKTHAKSFEFFHWKERKINTLSIKQIEDFIIYCHEDKNNAWDTIRKKLRLLSQLFDWAVKNNWLLENVVEENKNRIDDFLGTDVKKRRKPFTRDEVEKILNHVKENYSITNYNFIFFCFSTGLRVGEVIGLKWSQISEEFTVITVDNIKNKKPKANKIRSFKLSQSTTDILKLQQKFTEDFKDGFVFTNKCGKMLDDTALRNWWKKILKEINISHRPLYTTRHTFVTHTLRKTNDPLKTSAITGHSTKTMFEYYVTEVEKLQSEDLF